MTSQNTTVLGTCLGENLRCVESLWISLTPFIRIHRHSRCTTTSSQRELNCVTNACLMKTSSAVRSVFRGLCWVVQLFGGVKRDRSPGSGSLGQVVCSPAAGGLPLRLGNTLPCVFGVLALEMPPCLAASARSAPRAPCANFTPRNNGGRRTHTVKLWKSPQRTPHVTTPNWPWFGRCPNTGPLVSSQFHPFGWRSWQCISSAFPL